jgi:sulfonate transport system substrate-binding protein
MKKILSLLLVLCMLFSLAACASSPDAEDGEDSKPAGDDANSGGDAEDFPWDIEPLAEPTTLRIGYHTASTMHTPTYIAEENGWLDYLNIEVETIPFANGPALVEASSSWDCAVTGFGGVINGVLQHDIVVLSPATWDDGSSAFFVRKDSPIAKAGKGNNPDYPEVYGDAESWKGVEVFTSMGTTNHYTLAKTLEVFGLTLDDVTVTNMDVTSSNTAFKAGQGEVAGIWGSLIYSSDKADYIMASKAKWVDTGLVTDFVATREGLENNSEAILKWMELCIYIGEWCNENPEEAAEYMTELGEIDGIEADVSDNVQLINDNPYFTLEECYTASTEEAHDGKMLVYEAQNYDPLEFFVQQGNYTEDDLEKILGGNFDNQYIISVYENAK